MVIGNDKISTILGMAKSDDFVNSFLLYSNQTYLFAHCKNLSVTSAISPIPNSWSLPHIQ